MNLLLVSLGVLIILLIYILYVYFTSQESTLTKEGNLKTGLPYVTSIDSPTNTRYSYGIWIYVNTWDPNVEKTIFKRDNSLHVYLDQTAPILKCSMTMSDETEEEIIVTDNFPLQKWSCVIVSVDNQFMDIYLDGKLVKSQRFFKPDSSVMPKTPNDSDPIIFGSFDAYIKDFKRWTEPMDPQTAWNEYLKGSEHDNILKSLASYGIDVSVFRNNEIQSTFSLF